MTTSKRSPVARRSRSVDVKSSASNRWRAWRLLGAAGVAAALSACATYQSKPLEDRSPLLSDPDNIPVEVSGMQGGAAASHPIDPSDGFDLTEIGVIAAINNPDLRKQRAQWQVAGAQLFAAGLLPDPQISAGLDKPTSDTSGLVDAWSVGLGYDIVPLITRQARIDAARNQQDKVRLDMLWQEWQVIQQARSLAVRMQLEEARLALLGEMQSLYLDRFHRSAQALRDGDVTLDVNGTDLTALIDTLSQISQLKRTHNQTRHDLHLVLGLAPQVPLTLAPLPPVTTLSIDAVDTRLGHLAELRPDLLALKAGYESQEARVRSAILAQFPSLGLGINSARDTGDVKTFGLSISLSLPLFNGNRGQIAIERATRDQLREEYRSRLAQTQVDVDRLLALQAILSEQSDNLQTYLPQLRVLVDRARVAYGRGDIEALTFLNMESTWVNKRLEQISLTQATWENRIALEALLALPGYADEPLQAVAATTETSP